MDVPRQFLGAEWYAELEVNLQAYLVRAITDDGDPLIGLIQRENRGFAWVEIDPQHQTPAIDRAVRECLAILNARRETLREESRR
jgi:hypothetical protein